MPARKSAGTEASVEKTAPKANPALPGKEIRKLEDVALEVRRLFDEEKLNTAEIREKLEISYDVVNQIMLQSYKSTMNTPVVFEVQEKIRLGIEE